MARPATAASRWWGRPRRGGGRPGAAPRRSRRRRGGGRGRIHRPVDGLRPRRGRPGAAGRRPRGRGGGVRRVGPQRRMVLGPLRHLPRPDDRRARRVRRPCHAPGDGGRGRRGRPDRVGRGDRLPLRQGRHGGGRPEPRPGDPGEGGVAAARRAGIGEEDLRWLDGSERASSSGPRAWSAPPSRRTARRSNRPGWPGGWPAPSSAGASPSSSGPRPWPSRRGAGAAAEGADRPGDRHRGGGGPGHGGWTPSLHGQRRTLAPVYSLMVATAPPTRKFWSQAGLGRRQTFADHRHMIIYGQRTADGRIAFGGAGRPITSGPPCGPPSTRCRGSTGRWPGPWSSCSRPWTGWRSPTPGGGPGPGPRLAPLGRPRPAHRPRLGRRLRRRRRLHHQPGRPHPGRPGGRGGERPRPAPLGEPPLAELGARAPALARGERRPHGDAGRRPGRTAPGPAEPAGQGDGAVDRWLRGPRGGRRPMTATRSPHCSSPTPSGSTPATSPGWPTCWPRPRSPSRGSTPPCGGARAVEALYERTTLRHGDGTPRTKHVTTNVVVEVDRAQGTATARSYFTVLQAVTGEPPSTGGRRPLSRPVRTYGGRWRFSGRHMILDLAGDLSHHLRFDLDS